MKFKNKDDKTILVTLSKREQDKLKLPEVIEVEDLGMNRTLEEGEYTIKVDGSEVKVVILLDEEDNFHIVTGSLNEYTFKLIKDRPIRKYDIFRVLVNNLEKVKLVVET